MDSGGGAASGGGGSGGGPAPFLLKTYEMVDESSTDEIVSWTPSGTSFVVWNPPDFAARLLPSFFKHNNFSSFIRQLNTYGFRKVDPERWEFANEEFTRGQKHLLKNIHRRKPIHSHSHPPGVQDSERTALEEEIDRLSREKAAIQADLCRSQQQYPLTLTHIDAVELQVRSMERRQEKMVHFLQKALQNQNFVDNLVRMAGADSGQMDFSVIHRKRRLPGPLECSQEVAEAISSGKNEMGRVFQRDFCDKLKLELSPAVSDCILMTASTQGSNEDSGSPHGGRARMECLPFVPETLELSDTGVSFSSRKSTLFSRMADEVDDINPCHLNLTLASASMQAQGKKYMGRITNSEDRETRVSNSEREEDFGRLVGKKRDAAGDSDVANATSTREATKGGSNQAPAAPQGRVNDVFWEQFLTERPGSSDTEEASSSLRESSCDEQQEERNPGTDSVWKSRNGMKELSL